MKYLLVLLTLFTVNASFAQETKNFKIVNGGLVWQKVYESKDSINHIVSKLKRDGIIKDIEVSNNTVIGTIKDLSADYKGVGIGGMVAPIFIVSNRILASVTIDFKDGKYRVSIKNMTLKNTTDSPISKVGEMSSMETYALKKKNTMFKPTFLGDAATILNYTFNKIFESKKLEKEDDNW